MQKNKKLIHAIFALIFLSIQTAAFCQKDTLVNQLSPEGKKNGKWIEYYKNGKVESIAFYDNDKVDSLYCSYYPSGKIESKIWYKAGKKHGTYELYHENGNIKALYNYQADAPIYTSEYDINGKIAMFTVYINGRVFDSVILKEGKFVTH